ncbi:MAG: hypothetical protein ACFE9T_10435 [Promethearchaeota archaeon]
MDVNIKELFEIFNSFLQSIFIYLKYILIFTLLIIGTLTLLRLRGIYLQQRTKGIKDEEEKLKNVRLIWGITFLFLAFGILFNHLIYFLIWISNLFPEGFIFILFELLKTIIPLESGSNIEFLRSFTHPLIALFSFIGFLHLILSIYYLINSNRAVGNPRRQVLNLVAATVEIIFFGFTTFLPYFINC